MASSSEATALFFRDLFATRFFRTYTSDDPVGVELASHRAQARRRGHDDHGLGALARLSVV